MALLRLCGELLRQAHDVGERAGWLRAVGEAAAGSIRSAPPRCDRGPAQPRPIADKVHPRHVRRRLQSRASRRWPRTDPLGDVVVHVECAFKSLK